MRRPAPWRSREGMTMDSWKDLQDSTQHGGLQNPFGEFHAPMRKAMAEFSATMYDIARR